MGIVKSKVPTQNIWTVMGKLLRHERCPTISKAVEQGRAARSGSRREARQLRFLGMKQ